jgi:hypothetical protein
MALAAGETVPAVAIRFAVSPLLRAVIPLLSYT